MRNSIFIFLIISLFASCSGPERRPNPVFMPDMYYSTAYEPYAKSTFGYPNDKDSTDLPYNMTNGQSSLVPVEGTVPRNELNTLPYDLANDNDGYQASFDVMSPLDSTNLEYDLARGEKLYNQTCIACHGVAGDGKGPIVQTGAYLGVPNYKDREINVGSVHHVIMYGKNAMGSFASHFTDEDRWRVAEYVMHLKNK